MLKRFLVAIAVVAFSGISVQDAAAQQYMAGVKAGYVMADVDIDPEDFETDSRSGIGFGAFLQVPIGGSLSIQPELQYVPRGFEAEEDGAQQELKANYLQLPVLVQFHVATAGATPRLFVGPTLAFQLSCDVEASIGDFSGETSCDDADIPTKSADFGLVFGAGIDIPAGSVVVTLDGRYDLGVTDIYDGDEAEAKNRAWAFEAGVGLPLQ